MLWSEFVVLCIMLARVWYHSAEHQSVWLRSPYTVYMHIHLHGCRNVLKKYAFTWWFTMYNHSCGNRMPHEWLHSNYNLNNAAIRVYTLYDYYVFLSLHWHDGQSNVPCGTLDRLTHSKWYHFTVHVLLSQPIILPPLSFLQMHHDPSSSSTASNCNVCSVPSCIYWQSCEPFP